MPEFIHKGDDKKKFVQKMFDDISLQYDFLNHILSLGTDIYWRKKFIKQLPLKRGVCLLDVACGTGDVGFEILTKVPVKLICLDYSFNMIKLARNKAKAKQFDNILFLQGDGEKLPLKSESVDILTISYGFRNLGHYENALKEFYRVLRPGGTLGILEFSESKSKILGTLFQFYFNHVLPRIGAFFSKSDAYRYLPESVAHFPPREEICRKIIYSGFKRSTYKDLTFGITTIFSGTKGE